MKNPRFSELRRYLWWTVGAVLPLLLIIVQVQPYVSWNSGITG